MDADSALNEEASAVIITGTITITTDDPLQAAEHVDSIREQLAEIGRVDSTWLESTEVGATQRDLVARIATLRTSINRYTEWPGQTDDVEDLIALERRSLIVRANWSVPKLNRGR